MATAICDKCGKPFYWFGGKGRRLADIHSPCCGATASSPQANRLKLPVIMCNVTPVIGGIIAEKRTKRHRVSLLPDGELKIAYRIYAPTDEVRESAVGSLRVCFRYGEGLAMLEHDYQRLLKKAAEMREE